MANPLRHVGLASSSALQAAILIALNYFDGTFSTEGELHTYHSQNYLEVAGSKVGNGFTTGLGAFIAQNGGFAMISTDLEPIFVADLPEWPAYVAIPKIRHITTLSSEKNVLLGRARDLDRRDLARKSDIIRGQLIPAVGRSNLKDIGDAIFALQFTGSKLAEIESRPENLIPKMKSLRDQGIECLFMSSLGPAVVLISQLDRTRVIEALESVEFEVAHQGRVVSKVNLIHPAVELQ